MAEAAAPARDFFVSFNQADRTWATWIAWVLEEEGYTVWFQDRDFRENFVEHVEHMNRAHAETFRTLAVLSDNYLKSDFTLAEWSARFKQDPAAHEDRLVPVRVGLLASFEHILGTTIYEDLTNCQEHEARERLLRRVRKATAPQYGNKPRGRPGLPSGPPRAVPHKPEFPFDQSGRVVGGAHDIQPPGGANDIQRRRGVPLSLIITGAVVFIAALIVLFGNAKVLSNPAVPGVLAGALMGGLVGVLVGVALLFLLRLALIAPNPTAAIQPIRYFFFAIVLLPIFYWVSSGVLSKLLGPQGTDWYGLLFGIAVLTTILYPLSQWILKFGRTIAGVPMAQASSNLSWSHPPWP